MDRGVESIGDIFGVTLMETTLRGVHPLFGEDHDQKQEEAHQAEF